MFVVVCCCIIVVVFFTVMWLHYILSLDSCLLLMVSPLYYKSLFRFLRAKAHEDEEALIGKFAVISCDPDAPPAVTVAGKQQKDVMFVCVVLVCIISVCMRLYAAVACNLYNVCI